MKIVISGNPATKKNSMRPVFIGRRCPACGKGQRLIVLPSKAYEAYEKDALKQLRGARGRFDGERPLNVRCVYYMKTRRTVDLTNLLEATDDILVAAGVLPDDNSRIIAGHDGSRVRVDAKKPRVEIEITEVYENEW